MITCTHRSAFLPIFTHSLSACHPTTNVCEVKAKRALLNYAIIKDIPFNVGQVIKDSILYKNYAKMNLGYPFLIYGLCKKVGVLLEDNEAWIHRIKAIVVKKDKPGVPKPRERRDSHLPNHHHHHPMRRILSVLLLHSTTKSRT